MLRNSLKNFGNLSTEQVDDWLIRANLDGTRRAETLTLQEFADLANAVK